MRKTQVALAAMALVASTAVLADGVSAYGVIDLGLGITKTGSTTTRGFSNGTESPSLFGFKGTEDLSGGMKASFNLEAGFNAATGALDNGSYAKNTGSSYAAGGAVSTNFFGRAANVAISGGFGAVTAGLHMDPAFAAAAAVDPRGMGNGTGTMLNHWGYTTGYNPAILQGVFNSSSVMYTTPNMNGLQASASYGFGGTASSRQDGTSAVGATYQMDNVTIAGWSDTIYSDTANYKAVGNQGVGAGVVVSEGLTLKAIYNKATTYTTGATTAEKNAIGVGATYALASNLKATVAYYSKEDKKVSSSGLSQTVINLSYSLSPRTSAYFTYVNESANAQAGTYALANKTGSYTGIGILTSF